jgi:hypothetical protein
LCRNLIAHTRAQITLTKDFVPEGCPADFEAYDAVTMGAGTQWLDAYAFAEAHNITIPGVRPPAPDAPACADDVRTHRAATRPSVPSAAGSRAAGTAR